MKRLTLILALVTLSICFFACKSTTYSVSGYEWKLGIAMLSDGDSVTVVCVGSEDENYPTASVKKVTLTADNNVITVTEEGGKAYRFTYEPFDSSIESTTYKINGEAGSGFITVSTTKPQNGTEKPTAVMRIDGYALYFYA